MGTVDKLQGQEAEAVIISMATVCAGGGERLSDRIAVQRLVEEYR